MPALSATGDVFGMQTTVVNPPAAAAREPVPIVSLCVWPGSRKVHVDVDEPGASDEARARRFASRAFWRRPEANRRILPSTTKRSPTASRLAAGSMTRAFLIQREDMLKSEKVQVTSNSACSRLRCLGTWMLDAWNLAIVHSRACTCSGWPPAQR